MKRQKIVVLIALLIAVLGNEGQAKPSWKIPLEGGYRYIITVEYGGVFYRGGNDAYHTDINNGYYALDFSITSDISDPKVVAPESGTVVQIFSNPGAGLGYGVKIDHGDGYASETGHYADFPYVKVGDYVVQGQPLGVMGSTGDSTGKHVHLRTLYNGRCHSTVPESKPEPLSGYTGDALRAGKIVMSDNYFNPSTVLPGQYPDGTTNDRILAAYTANGGSGRFGTPWNNSSFGAYVHPWPDNANDPNVVWLQDFIEPDGHWWQIVDNPAAGQAFPVHGQILTFWHANYGYTNYGAPKSNEYYATHESNGHQLVVQTFVKGSTVHYLGYDTAAETSKEGRKRNI